MYDIKFYLINYFLILFLFRSIDAFKCLIRQCFIQTYEDLNIYFPFLLVSNWLWLLSAFFAILKSGECLLFSSIHFETGRIIWRYVQIFINKLVWCSIITWCTKCKGRNQLLYIVSLSLKDHKDHVIRTTNLIV